MTSQFTGGPDAANTDDAAAGAPGRRGLGAVLDRPVNRMVIFAGVLVIALLGGLGLGRVTSDGPARATPSAASEAADHTDDPAEPTHDHPAPGAGDAGDAGADGAGDGHDGHDHSGAPAPGSDDAASTAGDAGVSGLSVSQAGYRLVPEAASLPVGARHDFRFQVRGPDGRAVTTFEERHEELLHLIVVRRDLGGYQHLHPTLTGDGTWRVPLTLPEPGAWRAYADFAARDADGEAHELVLGVDLVAAGNFAPRPLPPATREAAVDGFTVTFEGTPQVGATQPLLFRIFTDGVPVRGLERYLGAYGHLVALREGDLGYVHVHPEEELVNGAVKFWLAAPSPGSYRFYFDFQVAGVVRTAEFTVTVP